MVLVPQLLPALIGGVSQQPNDLRSPTQCTEMVNCLPSVTEGLRKRPPTHFIGRLGATPGAYVRTHWIDRSPTERYALILGQSTLTVWDIISGSQCPVYGASATSSPTLTYLAAAADFKCQTIADYTLILNPGKTAAMAGTLSPAVPTTGTALSGHAYVWIRQAAFASNYIIRITANGTQSTYTVHTNNQPGGTVEAATDKIADDGTGNTFVTKLNTHADPTLVASAFGSVIKIVCDHTITELTVDDSLGGHGVAMVAINRAVEAFEDLPSICTDGYVVKVRGNTSENLDDYYVTFVADVPGAFGQGHWVETIASSTATSLDNTTMPHQLVRYVETAGNTYGSGLSAGSVFFRFTPVTWITRLVGDTTTNPDPSFIGKTINDIFFFRGRLGFVAGSNAILSEVSRYFNFFRTSVVSLLDGDPIDVASQSTTVVKFNHAVPFDKRLLLFSDHHQSELSGSPLLTPKTAAIDVVMQYDCTSRVRPLFNGRTMFFARDMTGFAGIYEVYNTLDGASTLDAADITSHIPKYITDDQGNKGLPWELAGSTASNLLAVRMIDNSGLYPTDNLFVYSYFWRGNEKAQSAWGTWTFDNAIIRSVWCAETSVYLILDRAGYMELERITVASGQVDTSSTIELLIDRKYLGSDPLMGSNSYNAVTNQTTITLPYATGGAGRMQVVTSEDGSQALGRIVPIVSETAGSGATPGTLTVAGDWSLGKFYVGQKYTMSFEFSEPIIRDARSGQVTHEGRWALRRALLILSRTGYLKVTVAAPGRDTDTIEFQPLTVDGYETLDDVNLLEGEVQFPILGDSTDVTITLLNDTPQPCSIGSCQWIGDYTSRLKSTRRKA